MEPAELKQYTVAQVRSWLEQGERIEGLSPMVIAPTRAWAMIHNPYIKDDDYFVAAIFIGSEVVAYTAAFPELINGERKWWFSSLWCNPAYRGKGYGLIVVGSLAEIYGIENCFDCFGAEETVQIFTILGMRTIYVPRYVLTIGKMNLRTMQGRMLHRCRIIQKGLSQAILKRPAKEEYTLRYLPMIDDKTYDFILRHRNDDLFLHTLEMMNWELRYPFYLSAPLHTHIQAETSFSANVPHIQFFAVQVLAGEEIVGFYMLKQCGQDLHVLYLYYDEKFENKVFASILDHILKLSILHFVTNNESLGKYIRHYIYFPKYNIANISFSYPESFKLPKNFTTQQADGDGFA